MRLMPSAQGQGDRGLRASDEDRERFVEVLREHHTAGRLTTDELEERVDQALAARTHADLDAVHEDLPRLPDRRRTEHRREVARRAFREHLRTYVLVMVLLVSIWALTGADYFWPVWPIGAMLLGGMKHTACRPRSVVTRRG
jgi:Domain of unknown function (DUF1707)/2TM domain